MQTNLDAGIANILAIFSLENQGWPQRDFRRCISSGSTRTIKREI